MLLSTLLFASLAFALPSVNRVKRLYQPDDVVAFGENGRVEVYQREYYNELTKNVTRGPPSFAHPDIDTTSAKETKGPTPTRTRLTKRMTKDKDGKLVERGCKPRMLLWDHYTTFRQWDVPMSRVVHAQAALASVTVTEGFTITNSIGVSQNVAFTWVKDFFSTTTTVSYEHSWASAYTAGYTFIVPQGLYGIVVSNPNTDRRYGEVYDGCIGHQTQVDSYKADSYRSHSFNNLNWVIGTITACTAKVYPIPMCIGRGKDE